MMKGWKLPALVVFWIPWSLAASTGALEPVPTPTPRASASPLPNDGWIETYSIPEMRIFRKEIPGTGLLAYRAEGTIPAPIGKLVTLMVETSRKPQWMDRVKEATILEQPSPMERIEYMHTVAPWPLTDREFLYYAKLEKSTESKTITVRMKSIEDPRRPIRPDRVRGSIREGTYTLTAISPTHTKFSAQTLADPKGRIPKFIVNFVGKMWARRVFDNIVKIASRPVIESSPLVADF